MDDTHPPRRVGRSIGAVLGGIAVGVILTLGTDAVLHVTGYFPPMGQPVPDAPLVWATVYRIIYGVLGSYIIARLAPDQPMGHALIGGIIGVVVSTMMRSEERRVGKECRSRWSPYH